MILGLVPLTAMLFFFVTVMGGKWISYQNALFAGQAFQFSAKIGDITHSLQKERGLSAGYVGSGGTHYGAEVVAQREETDRLTGELRRFMEELGDSPLATGPGHDLRPFFDLLEKQTPIRKTVDGLAPIKPFFAYYTELIKLSISHSEHLSTLNEDHRLDHFFRTDLALLWLRERSGLERGALNGVFSSGNYSTDTFAAVTRYINQQDEELRIFRAEASPDQVAALERRFKDPSIDRFHQLRTAALNRARKTDLLNRLYSQIGYGGLIHDFKNFVLRGDRRYIERFQSMFKAVMDTTAQYRDISGLSPEEMDDLETVIKTFEHYKTNLAIAAEMHRRGESIRAIDKAVKIDDEPALAAIKRLRQGVGGVDPAEWWKVSTRRLDLIAEVSHLVKKDAQAYIHSVTTETFSVVLVYGGLAILVLLITVAVALLVGYRLAGGIGESARILERVDDAGDFSLRVGLEGEDELGHMAGAFNRHLANLQAALDDINHVMDAVASRNFGERITVELPGDLEKVKLGINHMADDIEAFVAEQKRTAEALMQSNRELSQFAYAASHDLQEPLRMISSFTQLLARKYEGKLDEQADEFIHFTVDGVKRMQNLISGLLDYSRVDRQEVALVPTALGTIVKGALDNLKLALEESEAEIVMDQLPTVAADEGQLVQLFQNLIGNAIKYRRENSKPIVEIVAERRFSEWVICVKDNGIGIAAEFHDRVFTIFQRLHNDEKYRGAGVGLAICQKIVDRHKGRIWVESEPGKGSAFCFTLPAVE